MPDTEVYEINFQGEWDASALLVVICSALAGYNAVELILLIFTTFNVYKGLYFWSLLIATAGILPYVIGINVVYFGVGLRLAGWIVSICGWVCMVSGQSVVLYSRLGIVLGHGYDKLLKFVKWMIIVDGCIFHTLTMIFAFTTHYARDPTTWANGYFYVEKIQMTGFCLQEFIISGIYIWKAVDLIMTGERKHHHRIMAQLFAINLVIVFLDIGLLSLEYKNLFVCELAFKYLCYSIKLKLEFAVLSKLVEFTSGGKRRFSNFFGDTQGMLDSSVRNPSFATVARTETSPTVRSDTRPQWMYDVERLDTIPVAPNEKLTVEHTEDPISSRSNSDHNFNSEYSRPDRARTRDDCDLMYADAMRIVCKR